MKNKIEKEKRMNKNWFKSFNDPDFTFVKFIERDEEVSHIWVSFKGQNIVLKLYKTQTCIYIELLNRVRGDNYHLLKLRDMMLEAGDKLRENIKLKNTLSDKKREVHVVTTTLDRQINEITIQSMLKGD